MISNAVPAGGAFGLGVQYAMLSDYGFGPAVASSAIGVTSVWNLIVTLALPVLGRAGVADPGRGRPPTRSSAPSAGWSRSAVLLGVFTLVLRSERWAPKPGRLGDRVVARFHKGDGDPDIGDQRAAAVPRPDRGRGPRPVGPAHRHQLRRSSSPSTSCSWWRCTGWAAPPPGSTPSRCSPPSRWPGWPVSSRSRPGGLGTVDAALVGLLSAFGMSRDDALAANLLWRAATYFPQIFIGIGTFIAWRVQSAPAQGSAAPAPSV